MPPPICITGHPASRGTFPRRRHDELNNLFFFADRSFLVANIRDGQCHIIYCSDGFCRLTGYSRAEVMQRSASCEFLCGPLTSQQSVAGLREALQEGVEKHAEILYYRKDGESFFSFGPSSRIRDRVTAVFIRPLKLFTSAFKQNVRRDDARHLFRSLCEMSLLKINVCTTCVTHTIQKSRNRKMLVFAIRSEGPVIIDLRRLF